MFLPSGIREILVQESGVRIQESGFRNQESGIRNQEAGGERRAREAADNARCCRICDLRRTAPRIAKIGAPNAPRRCMNAAHIETCWLAKAMTLAETIHALAARWNGDRFVRHNSERQCRFRHMSPKAGPGHQRVALHLRIALGSDGF
jgi:hypothetical protein